MSNVIRFLESLGQRPAMSAMEYAAAVRAADVSEAQAEALLAREGQLLGDLVGGRSRVFCAIAMPEDDEAEQTPADSERVTV